MGTKKNNIFLFFFFLDKPSTKTTHPLVLLSIMGFSSEKCSICGKRGAVNEVYDDNVGEIVFKCTEHIHELQPVKKATAQRSKKNQQQSNTSQSIKSKLSTKKRTKTTLSRPATTSTVSSSSSSGTRQKCTRFLKRDKNILRFENSDKNGLFLKMRQKCIFFRKCDKNTLFIKNIIIKILLD